VGNNPQKLTIMSKCYAKVKDIRLKSRILGGTRSGGASPQLPLGWSFFIYPDSINRAVKIAVGSGIPLESFPGSTWSRTSNKSF
jgi:hypothetical protein